MSGRLAIKLPSPTSHFKGHRSEHRYGKALKPLTQRYEQRLCRGPLSELGVLFRIIVYHLRVDTLEQITTMNEAELNALPLGVVRLDRAGTIINYNDAEARLAHRTARAIGLNFFRDVAPCTAVNEFQGRFSDFITQPENRTEPFKFLFRFGWGGEREVTITMVKRDFPEERIYVVVSTNGLPMESKRS